MSAPVFDYLRRYRFKKVVLCNDTEIGLRAVIAIHSTALGPATGGLRMWTYPSEEAAIMDALRLARGMTYKYAAAGVNLGGGKAVIIGDPRKDKSEALLRAMGRMIDQLGGEYITGEDVGTTLEDMETVYSETDHVVTLPEHAGGAGDISPATALGSIQAMRACAERAWGTPELGGKRVALQGLGVVGSKALGMLVEAGAEVIVADIDEEKVEKALQEFQVKAVDPEDIYAQEVDIFAPYALGAVINDDTIPRLKAKIVAGAANNILAEERHGDELERRGIVYAVDFVANSGGTVFDTDRYRKGGFQPERAMANVRRIFERIEEIFAIADRDRIPYYGAAERLAEERIEAMNKVRLLGRPDTAHY
ncbi:MAG: Glu/Leu/Phe/Val dehydrogenase dimerization region [Rubrobacteraceae bacterium]|nr:Glu/Leu/Phe/Val dehydrogenase dimerization region [Rubrobacteraceae bacterium]